MKEVLSLIDYLSSLSNICSVRYVVFSEKRLEVVSQMFSYDYLNRAVVLPSFSSLESRNDECVLNFCLG